jgi:hypothetical protein
MKVCKTFIQDDRTSSATKCRNCGCEGWEHDVQGKGLLAYINAMPPRPPLTRKEVDERLKEMFAPKPVEKFTLPPMGEEMYKLFNGLLKEEMERIILDSNR